MRYSRPLGRIGLSCMIGLLYTLSAPAQLVITEVMSGSAHPASDQVTGFGGLANGDWFELVNMGGAQLDLTGYLWDDNGRLSNPNGFTQFPNGFVLQPREAVLVVEESQFAVDAVGGWRESWNVPTSLRVLSRDAMLGGDTFSGLSSTNGDEVNIYAPDRSLVASVTLPALGVLRGFSFEWDSAGTSLELSVEGENFAYRAVQDGSETAGPFPVLDVASPGLFVVPGSGIDGDFNDDGQFGCADVNALVAAIAGGTHPAGFDLTGDALVNDADLTDWLAEAGNVNLPNHHAYLRGDANLDGVTDGSDFNLWNSNKFTATAAWCSGDFNADGSVDGSDFNLWNSNKFLAADGGTLVPEPTSIATTALGILAAIHVLARRNG